MPRILGRSHRPVSEGLTISTSTDTKRTVHQLGGPGLAPVESSAKPSAPHQHSQTVPGEIALHEANNASQPQKELSMSTETRKAVQGEPKEGAQPVHKTNTAGQFQEGLRHTTSTPFFIGPLRYCGRGGDGIWLL